MDQPVKGIGGHLGDHGGVVEEVVVLRPEDNFDADEEGDMVSECGICSGFTM